MESIVASCGASGQYWQPIKVKFLKGNYNRVTRSCFLMVIRHTRHFVGWSIIMRTTEQQYIIVEMY